MTSIPYKELNGSGDHMPCLGLGTWQLFDKEGQNQQCADVVARAIELGYRHIDSAWIYGNGRLVGQGIKDSGIQRSDLFLTSKIFRDHLAPDDVRKYCSIILEDFGTDYLDLLLIHWPNEGIPIKETLDAFKGLQTSGKIRNIGVSNFKIYHFEDAWNGGAWKAAQDLGIEIVTNQVECHPWLKQAYLKEYCKLRSMVFTAYSPLGGGKVLEDTTIAELASNGRTVAQVCLKYLLQEGLVIIPKASSEDRLKENMHSFGCELSTEEITNINAISVVERMIHGRPDYHSVEELNFERDTETLDRILRDI